MYTSVQQVLELIKESVSPWHTVEVVARRLDKASFTRLSLGEPWHLEEGMSYYVEGYGSTLLAFSIGTGDKTAPQALRLAASHTDFPGFRVKPSASFIKDGYGLLNVEPYGGLILHSWQNRPLSLAGRVVLRGDSPFAPRVELFDAARPLFTIPELAIHMNRKVNEGVALKKQKDMLPLFAHFGKVAEKDFFPQFLARELGCDTSDILSYELNLYPYEGGCQLGLAGEFVSAPRLDNLTSVEACLQGIQTAHALTQKHELEGIRLAAFFDHEEIGSRTKQGAGSALLLQVLERIYLALGCGNDALWQAIGNGFMLSVDVAHGLHPSYPEKNDPTSRPFLCGGVVLKQAASQSYAGDAEAIAIVRALCDAHGIPHQTFVNHSDQPGGSTLGSIASALVPLRTMDIGVPLLSMHAARETMGAPDQKALNDLLQVFLGQ